MYVANVATNKTKYHGLIQALSTLMVIKNSSLILTL
jgi:hypothetical protein